MVVDIKAEVVPSSVALLLVPQIKYVPAVMSVACVMVTFAAVEASAAKMDTGSMEMTVAALIFWMGYIWAAPEDEPENKPAEYSSYERAKVKMNLTDSTEADPASDGGFRGDQLLIVEVLTGQYAGKQLQVYNYVGPLYGGPLAEGDTAVLAISTYADGSHIGTVYEFDRMEALVVVLGLFLIVTVLVGGKTGAKSLISLLVTLVCLFYILIPGLMKGAPTLLLVFAVCAFISVVSLTILSGVEKKSVCAMLGTIAGTGMALLFALLAQKLTRIDGLRLSDVEPLLQLRQQGMDIGLRGLLAGGIAISALGAVMDVTMGISSAMCEISAADPKITAGKLFRSGMNIGRDMVGTMTNTLILAFLGSSFTLILYLYSIGLQPYQLWSSAFLSTEVISSVSSSVGVILSIPLTALITALTLTRNRSQNQK